MDHNPWIKMEAIGELKNLYTALEARSAGNKALLRKFRDTLKARGGLEKLVGARAGKWAPWRSTSK